MAKLHAEKTAVIDARPEAVYAVLSDYRNHHSHILPKGNFSKIQVKKGGQGAGTVFLVRTRVLGTERNLEMVVTEPVPGRILVETDTLSDLVTTFTISPLNNGRTTNLKIATDWKASPGIVGIIERLVTPRAMRKIYAVEMIQLAYYMANK